MNRTKIPWADYTWTPIEGCSPASEGCAHCYAAAMAHRFGRPWGRAVFHPERLDQPAKVKKPSRVFVCSTSDFWHASVDPQWHNDVFCAMARARQHTYFLLTKRPQHIPFSYEPPPNVWLGVTCENQARADERWPILCQINAAVRFVSVEPMLGPVTFNGFASRPDWVIAGPETGAGARQCQVEWMRNLSAESPCFFDKRNGVAVRREWPAGKDIGK